MKLIADNKIPHITELFSNNSDVTFVQGEEISRIHLQDATILLTRTVTTINAALLSNTSIQFVGTATTGIDHVDTEWLANNNILFANAAGANSTAVADYVFCCIAALKNHGHLNKKKLTAGIIGCGRIGHLVATLLKNNGFDIICYDPLREEKSDFYFASLEELMSESDLITLHTPLTYTGQHPTFHMINDALIKKIKKNAVLINTARGGVIDQSALLKTNTIILCLDVWENEPDISLELLHKVAIGTPHIAGYSARAKYRATQMIYEQAADFFGWHKIISAENKAGAHHTIDFPAALAHYNPLTHTEYFRRAFNNTLDTKAVFIDARKNYPLREELL